MLTRRTFHGMALAAVTGAPAVLRADPDSEVNGVKIGVQSYSFRDRSLDDAIAAMREIGLSYCELWSGHLEPPKGTAPDELKKWRTSPATLDQMKEVRQKFGKAGIRIYAMNYSFRKNHTDEEVLHGMEMARRLGTKYITASSTVDQAERLNRLAAQKGVVVAMHNHANIKDPNEYATPESFAKATQGRPHIKINLDIGHFTAADFDPVAYLREHHKNVVTLHVKDRKKSQGPNVEFGQGDTPITEVLQLLKANRGWSIPAMIEYEYKGADAVAEVRKSYEYMKKALL